MFINQPEYGFGQLIQAELLAEQAGRHRWKVLEFAVAWSNHAGVTMLFNSVQEFLANGGSVRVTAGLDFGRTTYEGLSKLLKLGSGADIITYVFFDENPACTFHPKVFLFSNTKEAYLLVGSNNLTGAGLETNIEATLSFSGDLGDATIQGACQALAAWRDEENDLRIRRLTPELLEQLWSSGYVLTEEEVRIRRNSDDGLRATTTPPIFGRSSIRPLRPGSRTTKRTATSIGRTTGSAFGEVLLMRVRPRRDGGQLQISMKILGALFMNGVKEVVSVDGSIRPIGYNKARGVQNTARFEAPEMRGMKNPVARFQWVNIGHAGGGLNRLLQYEIFDADNNVEGRTILRKLEKGIKTIPLTNLEELSQEETVLSISKRSNAQWYRLDSA